MDYVEFPITSIIANFLKAAETAHLLSLQIDISCCYENEENKLPDILWCCKNLSSLYLVGFKKIAENIKQLFHLQSLRIELAHSSQSLHLPETLNQLHSLRSLTIKWINHINFPTQLVECKQLMVLKLFGLTHYEVALSVLDQLCNLKSLSIGNMPDQMRTLPDNLACLQKLEKLVLLRCNLITISVVSKLLSLRSLHLCALSLYNLPEDIGDLKNLAELKIEIFKRLH